MSKKKKKIPSALLVVGFIAGMLAVSYPFISNAWNTHRDNQLINSYTIEVAKADFSAELEKAERYNNELLPGNLTDFLYSGGGNNSVDENYDKALNVRGDGMMGFISIPRIDMKAPIYHTTSDAVLEKGVGHIVGTALPVGGMGTHCVLAAHRGLPDNTLFTDLDRIAEGDQFYITTLDETLAYEVDQILVVKPNETDALQPQANMDYVTLVTCTPYGVNTHRLLVRGHRVPYVPAIEAAQASNSIKSMNTSYGLVAIVAIAAALVIVVILYLLIVLPAKRKKRRREENARLQALLAQNYRTRQKNSPPQRYAPAQNNSPRVYTNGVVYYYGNPGACSKRYR